MLVNPVSKSFNSRARQTGSNYSSFNGSVGMLTVLIYILMLENIFRGKGAFFGLIMDRIRGKWTGKWLKSSRQNGLGLFFSVIISNYPLFTVIRYRSNSGSAAFRLRWLFFGWVSSELTIHLSKLQLLPGNNSFYFLVSSSTAHLE